MNVRASSPRAAMPIRHRAHSHGETVMARLLLGVTGSVAAIKTPELLAALRAAGHDVRVVATGPSLYFFDPAELEPVDGDAGGGHDRRVALPR